MTGDWFGAREDLESRGIKFEGRWRGAFYGVLASEEGAGGFFDQELAFGAVVDFDKALGTQLLDGLDGFIEGRWRDPASVDNPNEAVRAAGMFNPSPYETGVDWRLAACGLRYSTPGLGGRKGLLALSGGWLRPVREFLNQPLSLNFLNAAIQSAKGLGGNIPFSSGFSTWGGTVEVKPLDWQYTKAGLFMSYPEGTLAENHGLMMQGDAHDPANNGEFFMGETGFTPLVGEGRLPGKYAFGGYFYGQGNADGGSRYGFYWQADQMLFREPGSAEEGLRLFTMVSFAPPYNNRWPLYAQGGLVYQGPAPGRPADFAQVAVAGGRDSRSSNRTGTMVVEGGYRVQINGWAFLQPFVQCIIQPAGGPEVSDGFIAGFFTGVNF